MSPGRLHGLDEQAPGEAPVLSPETLFLQIWASASAHPAPFVISRH